MADAADHPVTQFGDAARKVLDREAEREEATVFDLEPVIEDREAQRSATLRMIGVSHRQGRISISGTS